MRYEEPITLTSVKTTGAATKFPEGDDIYNNSYTRLVKDKLNIDIEYEWVVDSTQEKAKMATMLASGNLPDFFLVDAANFSKLANADAVMEISEVYETYASDELKSRDNDFIEGYNSAFIGEKQYGIARLGFGLISLPNIMWIRSDWLEESGMDAPETLDELSELALKFMEQHEGAYGIALDKELTSAMSGISGIANGCHAYPKSWIKDEEGRITYGSIQPEMKETLEILQDMYKKGILSQEFGVKDAMKAKEDIVAGKVGITFGANWLGWHIFTDAVKNDPNAVWQAFPVPSIDEETVYLQGEWPITSYWVINKDCKNPEAVIKMMNLYVEEDEHGSLNDLTYGEGLDYGTFPAFQENPENDYQNHVAIAQALATGDESLITRAQTRAVYDLCLKWRNDKDPEGMGPYAQMSDAGSSYSVIKNYVDEDRILLSELRGADPAGYAQVKSTLQKQEDEAFTKIIMGAPIEEFDTFVETWKKLGGEAATEEINVTFNK